MNFQRIKEGDILYFEKIVWSNVKIIKKERIKESGKKKF